MTEILYGLSAKVTRKPCPTGLSRCEYASIATAAPNSYDSWLVSNYDNTLLYSVLIVDPAIVFVRSLDLSEVLLTIPWDFGSVDWSIYEIALARSRCPILIFFLKASLSKIWKAENLNTVHLLVCRSSRYSHGWAASTSAFVDNGLFICSQRTDSVRRVGVVIRLIFLLLTCFSFWLVFH